MSRLRRVQRLVRKGRLTVDEVFLREMIDVFERHFGLEATVLGPSGTETPFVAFVRAVCAEVDDPKLTVAEICDYGRKHGLREDDGQ